jgi:hypothetical protein
MRELQRLRDGTKRADGLLQQPDDQHVVLELCVRVVRGDVLQMHDGRRLHMPIDRLQDEHRQLLPVHELQRLHECVQQRDELLHVAQHTDDQLLDEVRVRVDGRHVHAVHDECGLDVRIRLLRDEHGLLLQLRELQQLHDGLQRGDELLRHALDPDDDVLDGHVVRLVGLHLFALYDEHGNDVQVVLLRA